MPPVMSPTLSAAAETCLWRALPTLTLHIRRCGGSTNHWRTGVGRVALTSSKLSTATIPSYRSARLTRLPLLSGPAGDCRPKPNGNGRRAPVGNSPTRGRLRPMACCWPMSGLASFRGNGCVGVPPTQWQLAAFPPTCAACSTCWATCGNGPPTPGRRRATTGAPHRHVALRRTQMSQR